MQLRLLEPGTAFERGLERKYGATVTARTTSFYPAPREYLHSDFRKTTNNNNIWGFGTPETDELIRIYQEDMNLDARLAAMHQLDAIVHDEAFYIPFWGAPYVRVAYWDYIRFPASYLPRRTYRLTDHLVYWFDPERKAALDEAMRTNTALPVDREIDKDYYGIRKGLGSLPDAGNRP